MSEKKFTVLLFILAMVGLFLFSYKFYLDSKVYNPGQSIVTNVYEDDFYYQNAVAFLSKNKIPFKDYNLSLITTQDDAGMSFLERSLGKNKVEAYLRKHDLQVVGHTVRFYKEFEKREIFVYLNSKTGEILGFDEILKDDTKRPSFNEEIDAEKLAITFLQEMKIETLGLEKVYANKDVKQNRLDYFFSYKDLKSELDTKYGQGHVEYSVIVSGNKVAGMKKYLFIPEDFAREINYVSSVGNFLALLSYFVTALMALLAVIFCVKAFTEKGKDSYKKVHWKIFAIIFAGLVVTAFFANMDSIMYLVASYPTDQSLNIYILTAIISAVTFGLVTPVIVFMSGVAGKHLDEQMNHNQMSHLGNRSEIWTSIYKGYLIAFLSLGLTSLIYVFGEKYLDVWTYGVGNQYSSTLFVLPFLSAIYLGLASSFGEEIIFRYFGFSVTKKYLKNTVLAMLIITIIWAVGHSNYPVFPVYFRGIELVIGGMVWAYFILRYNLLTTISAHYIYNVFLFAMPLVLTDSPFLAINGVLAFLFPMILFVIYTYIPQK